MRRFSPRAGTRLPEQAGTPTAVVLGPLFLDVVFSSFEKLPLPGQELWCEDCTFVAGGAANQARALRRMGFDVQLCSFVGQDLPGRMVRHLLNDDGICVALLQPVARQSVTAAISVRSDRAMVSSGTNESPPLSGPAPDLLMCDLRALSRNEEIVSRWRRQGTFVLGDVGWDPSGEWDMRDLSPLRLVDLFVPNEEEARNYTRTNSAESAAEILVQLVPTVVVTRGEHGTVAAANASTLGRTPGSSEVELFSLPGIPTNSIDPTGAGDVFSAVLAWGALRGATLRQAVSLASLAGALSTERPGGTGSPTPDELRARAGESSFGGIPAGFDLALLTTEY